MKKVLLLVLITVLLLTSATVALAKPTVSNTVPSMHDGTGIVTVDFADPYGAITVTVDGSNSGATGF